MGERALFSAVFIEFIGPYVPKRRRITSDIWDPDASGYLDDAVSRPD